MPDHSILHTIFELPYYKHEDANEKVCANSEVFSKTQLRQSAGTFNEQRRYIRPNPIDNISN